jgi:hypothetical protein
MRPLFRFAPVLGLVLWATEATAASSHLTYYGGPVVSNPTVVAVNWGPNVDPNVQYGMPAFYSAILDSPYLDWVSEYSTVGLTGESAPDAGSNQRIGRGTFVNSYTITPSLTGTFLSNTAILTELEEQIAAGNLPMPQLDAQGNPNTLYMVDFQQPGRRHPVRGGGHAASWQPKRRSGLHPGPK